MLHRIFFIALIFLLSLMALPDSFAQQPADAAAAVSGKRISSDDILKVILIPMFLWFAQGVLVNGIRRYHTIRSLYAEIVSIVDWLTKVKAAFTKWEKANIDRTPPVRPHALSRITWDLPMLTTVYDHAQDDIRATLWGKEIPNVHNLYYRFVQLHTRFRVLAREVESAKRDEARLEDLPSDKKAIAAIISSEIDGDMVLVRVNAEKIGDELAALCKYGEPINCANAQFRSRKIYWLYGLAFFGLISIAAAALIWL